MRTPYNAEIAWSIPPQLERLIPFIHALHALLHRSYATAPNGVNGYIKEIHQSFWRYLNMMENCVNEMGDIEFSSLE